MRFVLCFFAVLSLALKGSEYHFEPLFETGGRPAACSTQSALLRMVTSAEELVSRVLGKGKRGILLIGSADSLQRFLQACKRNEVLTPALFAISTDSHQYLADAFFRAINRPDVRGNLWGGVFADGVVTVPSIDFERTDAQSCWQVLEAAFNADEGTSWLGRSMAELGRSLFCGLRSAYDWMRGL